MSDGGQSPAAGAAGRASERLTLSVVVINYGTAELTIQCLESLAPEMVSLAAAGVGAGVVVVDNASRDDSADRIEAAIAERGWGGEAEARRDVGGPQAEAPRDGGGPQGEAPRDGGGTQEGWARLVRSPVNGGFSAGNNVGIKAQEAEFYLLLNSDTIVRPGALAELLRAAEARPRAGIIGPRLTWPDDRPQGSAFRARRPICELVRAAATGPVTSLVRALAGEVESTLPIGDEPIEAEWVSFACAMIRREVVEQVGLLDETYFMYFEDMDYCMMAREAGFDVVHWPAAKVVHLRGGTSPVKEASAARKRRPEYFYRSRTWYFVKHFGRLGLWRANIYWWLGRVVAALREMFGRPGYSCKGEWRDIWIGAWRTG